MTMAKMIFRGMLSCAVLITIVLSAAWLQYEFAHKYWGVEFSLFCADERAGPLPSAHDAQPAPDELGRYTALVNELGRRIASIQSMDEQALMACTEVKRGEYIGATLFSRLELTQWRSLALTQIDPIQARRAVKRSVEELIKIQNSERDKLQNNKLSPQLISLRLQGKTLDKNGNAKRMSVSVVKTLAVLDSRAAMAAQAPVVMGSSVAVTALGAAVLWALVTLTRRRTWVLMVLLTVWLTSGLVMQATSLGVPVLRSVAARHLADWHGVWIPLWFAGAGFALYHLARWDPWNIADRMLMFYEDEKSVGLLGRAALLLGLVVVVGTLVEQDSHRSELWLGLTMFGLAMVAGRNSLLLRAGADASFGHGFVLCLSLFLSLLAAYLHDMGSVLLILGIAAGWLLMYSSTKWAIGLLGIAAAGSLWWAVQLQAPYQPPEDAASASMDAACPTLEGQPQWMQDLIRRSERIENAICLNVGSGSSDVYRSLAMAQSGWNAGLHGHGLADFPANGLAAERSADRTIVQLLLDYMAAPMVSAYGAAGVALLFAYAAALFWLCAQALGALIRRDEDVGTSLQQFLAVWAGLGLLAAALRTLISSAGALSAIPLTGQPIPGVSHGPAAAAMFGLCLGVALAAQPKLPRLSA